MCGVFGFVSKNMLDPDIVRRGLVSLEYRGYDSWGVASSQNQKFLVKKSVGEVSREPLHFAKVQLALGHTRWATHGGVTEKNAHPHLSKGNRFALIHNGIIENADALKKKYLSKYTFLSETDSEVALNLFVDLFSKSKKVEDAFWRMISLLDGLNAIVIADALTDQIFVAKYGSPLVIGIKPDLTFISSDAFALHDYTDQLIFLEDGQGAIISKNNLKIIDITSKKKVSPSVVTIDPELNSKNKNAFSTHMESEIFQQPAVLENIARENISAYAQAVSMLQNARNLYLTGCGTAYHAAQVGEYFLTQRLQKNVRAVLASEFEHVLPIIQKDDLVVVLSQSGETIDVLEPVQKLKKQGVKILSLVNVPHSSLYRIADVSVLVHAGREQAVAATKSFTAQVSTLWLLAELLSDVPPGAIQKQLLRAADEMRNILNSHYNFDSGMENVFILGNGIYSVLAREIALKLKEICYIHAEGLVAAELKHGTLALIEPGVTCWALIGENAVAIESSIREVLARGGTVQCIGELLNLDFWPTGTSFLGEILTTVLWGQLAALKIAEQKGLNPDRPRNLAKSVTVK